MVFQRLCVSGQLGRRTKQCISRKVDTHQPPDGLHNCQIRNQRVVAFIQGVQSFSNAVDFAFLVPTKFKSISVVSKPILNVWRSQIISRLLQGFITNAYLLFLRTIKSQSTISQCGESLHGIYAAKHQNWGKSSKKVLAMKLHILIKVSLPSLNFCLVVLRLSPVTVAFIFSRLRRIILKIPCFFTKPNKTKLCVGCISLKSFQRLWKTWDSEKSWNREDESYINVTLELVFFALQFILLVVKYWIKSFCKS